jgi:FkbM family methyltransferase
MGSNPAARIPRHFHFIFGLRPQTEPFHVMHYLCLESCRQVHRPDRITLYYHHLPYGPYWDAIAPHLHLERVALNSFVSGFRYPDPSFKPLRYAHHADFLRLEKLVEHGGVYADIDTLFVRPLPSELFEESFVIGRESDVWHPIKKDSEQSLCNAFLMAEPNAPFAVRWLAGMRDAFDGTWSNHSTLLPRRIAAAMEAEGNTGVRIEPPDSFYAYPASPQGIFDLFEGSALPAARYSIHLWEHLWRDRKRQDFSLFHQGLLTEEWVRASGAPYAQLAKPFLPPKPIAPSSAHPSEHFLDFAEEARITFRSLGGLLLFPLIRLLRPGYGRLDLARAHFAYRKALRHMRPRNSFEQSLLRWVVQWDEYGIFRERLRADDVVVDVGAHVGSFAFACHAAGSRRVFSFEPDPQNARRLRENAAPLKGVETTESAVFRSDIPVAELRHSGAPEHNTGEGSVMFGGARTVAVVALDDILRRFERVALLKLDCEGSEFPILLTSGELDRVAKIVGEFHDVPADRMTDLDPLARLDGFADYRAEHIRTLLESKGFSVVIQYTSALHGLFEAVR